MLVSGAYEFLRPGGNPGLAETMAAMNKAFGFMGYDVGLLSPAEAEALRADSIPAWPWQKTAREEPYTVIPVDGGRKVGFLRFPSLGLDEDQPSDDLIRRLSARIQKERDGVDLLIGLCDWGWVAENAYLQARAESVPDILLGSGSGAGVNGRILADGRALWVRPYDKGRSLVEVAVYQWPQRENSFAWKEVTNYKTSSIGMNDTIKDNPEVDAMFGD
ncbi:hypothetical protein [Pseudodesulfovibrio indicus]|uniref:Uncharacterized protein n=1 Tax=Pseudodesulfovibrio indicus TaxID=1716143 RepID=A0A126QNW3_9BACT|nr:hypothetical protein [Pseudodesulfovibrio indicus]AMK11733.1 hypothetical protein AWY79_11725 [Pseudodesulfovibrio indicus]TDT88268.1 hypothetical protein EDC59_10681 [Pseudodesulfovibrio indicus]